MAGFNSIQEDKEGEFGFTENTADLSTRITISESTLPVYDILKKTENVRDKFCIIGLKGKMTLECLSNHFDEWHDIYFDDSMNMELAAWLLADGDW